MISTVLFYILAGLAIAGAISTVYHRNPLYSAISLVGTFIALSGIYITLAAPFIAAVQILIYAGAIMVLVIFVIMLLNMDDEPTRNRLRYLFVLGGGLGALLLGQTFYIYSSVVRATVAQPEQPQTTGLTMSIGEGMFTKYLLPVEIVGILLLMAIIGAVILVRRLNQSHLELVVDNESARDYDLQPGLRTGE